MEIHDPAVYRAVFVYVRAIIIVYYSVSVVKGFLKHLDVVYVFA